MAITDAKKILRKKIIGITCHNSLNLAKKAIKNNCDYLAFGAFFATKTKKVSFKASKGSSLTINFTLFFLQIFLIFFPIIIVFLRE